MLKRKKSKNIISDKRSYSLIDKIWSNQDKTKNKIKTEN